MCVCEWKVGQARKNPLRVGGIGGSTADMLVASHLQIWNWACVGVCVLSLSLRVKSFNAKAPVGTEPH